MAAAKIKKGDKVVVLSGKDKGRHGEVVKVDAEGRARWSSPASTSHARHTKPTPGAIRRAASSAREAPLHVSKVALEDPKTGKPTRVRFEERDGKKVRVAVRSGELING